MRRKERAGGGCEAGEGEWGLPASATIRPSRCSSTPRLGLGSLTHVHWREFRT